MPNTTTQDIYLAMVQGNGMHLKCIPLVSRTNAICLAAVKQNGYAIQYVPTQTPELCLAAVKEVGFALQFVKVQTLDIIIEAIKSKPDCCVYADSKLFPRC